MRPQFTARLRDKVIERGHERFDILGNFIMWGAIRSQKSRRIILFCVYK